MEPDPNYFGEHGPELLNLPAGSKVDRAVFRWCKCGHAEGVHWGLNFGTARFVIENVPLQCHADACDCTELRLRKPSRLRRLWNGEG